jgi:hypothetical protein
MVSKDRIKVQPNYVEKEKEESILKQRTRFSNAKINFRQIEVKD